MAAYAILLAAGRGTRFGGATPKQFVQLEGKPIYQYTQLLFTVSPVFEAVVTVVGTDRLEQIRAEVEAMHGGSTPVVVTPGGETRAASCLCGLRALAELGTIRDEDIVFIHDAARPFLTAEMVDDLIRAMEFEDAVTLAVQSTETLLEVSSDGNVVSVPNRSTFWRAQTPQVFRYGLLSSAYRLSEQKGLLDNTDECSLVRRAFPQQRIAVVPGDVRNIKVTHPDDYAMVSSHLKEEELL